MYCEMNVWENEKCCGNTSLRRVFPHFYRNTENMYSISFRKYRDAKNINSLCSLLVPSLHQQLLLVLCFYQVIETWFWTIQLWVIFKLKVDYSSFSSAGSACDKWSLKGQHARYCCILIKLPCNYSDLSSSSAVVLVVTGKSNEALYLLNDVRVNIS